MIDLDYVQPVIDGRWHRTQKLLEMPQPGELITTLCGQTEVVEYGGKGQVTVQTCWSCDLAYRHQHGYEVLPDHPALGPAAPRRARPYVP